MTALPAWVSSRSSTAPLWMAWGVSRALMCAILTAPLEILATGDVMYYRDVSDKVLADSDSVAVWEYPIGSLFVVVAVNLLAGTSYADYLVAFVIASLACDFLVTKALLRCSTSGEANLSGAWLWVLASLLLGPVALTRLDVFVCAAAAVGVAAIAAGRNFLGVSFLWVGAAMKVWPGLVLLPLLTTAQGRMRALWSGVVVGALVVTGAAVLRVLHLLPHFATYQRQRGVQVESLWALPLLWARQFDANYAITYEFGSVQISGPGADEVLAVSTAVFAAAVLLALWFVHRRLASYSPFETITCGGIVLVGAALLTNKVLSPQYVLWLVVMVAAAGGHTLVRLRRPAIGLLIAAATSHMLFPWSWERLIAGDLLPTLLSTVRALALLYVVVNVVKQINRLPDKNRAAASTPVHLIGSPA